MVILSIIRQGLSADVATYCSRSADAGVTSGMEVGSEGDGQVRGGCWNADGGTGALWTRPVEGVRHDLHCLRINILYLQPMNMHTHIILYTLLI